MIKSLIQSFRRKTLKDSLNFAGMTWVEVAQIPNGELQINTSSMNPEQHTRYVLIMQEHGYTAVDKRGHMEYWK